MFITNRDYSRDVVDELRNKSLHFDLVTAYIALGSQEKKSLDGKMHILNSEK